MAHSISNAEIKRFKKAVEEGEIWHLASKVFKNPGTLPLEPFHKKIAEWISLALPYSPMGVPLVLHICGFRGCLKSTIASVAVVCALLQDEGDLRLLVASGVIAKSDEIVNYVNQWLALPIVAAAYPEMANQAVEAEWTSPRRKGVYREPTVTVTCPRSVKAGSHFNFILADDVVSDQTKTVDAVEKSKEDFWDMLPLLEPDAHLLHLSTRVSPYDIIAEAKEKGEPVLEIPILKRDGTPQWIEKFPPSVIESLKAANARMFASQYLLAPLPEEDDVEFQKADILDAVQGMAEVKPFVKWGQYVINADWSGGKGRDQIAIVSSLWFQDRRVCIFRGFETADTIERALRRIVEIYLECLGSDSPYEPVLRIENTNGAEAYDARIQNIARNSGLKGIQVIWGTPRNVSGARASRIRDLQQGFAENKIAIIGSNYGIFVEQALRYSVRKSDQTDDVLDSAAQNYELCFSLPPSVPKQRIVKGRQYLDESQYPETLRVTYDQRQLIKAGITQRPDGAPLWAGGGEMTFTLKLLSNPAHRVWFKRVQDAGVSPIDSGFGNSNSESQPRTFPTDAVPYGVSRMWSGGALVNNENADDANERACAEDQRRRLDPYGTS